MKGIVEWWNGGGLGAESHHSCVPSFHHSRRLKQGFTLIELLAVVTIMAIILVAAIPIFQSMGKRDLGAATAQLRATLRLARQYAVTQRQTVFVVFPDNSAPCSTNDVDKLLRAYAVVASNTTTHAYEYITDWKYLPQGVYFDDSSQASSIWMPDHVTPFSFPFPNSEGTPRAMPHICFRPSGRAYAYQGGTSWDNNEYTVYITTGRFYSKNDQNTRLESGIHPVGVTNNVQVRRYSGNVVIRTQSSDTY